jgi:diguanylate cyclase (GGDEF)-like protein
MRALIGWRFIIAIALPLLLASVGVLSLTNDLMGQVAGGVDRAELSRNRDVVQRALKATEQQLIELARAAASKAQLPVLASDRAVNAKSPFDAALIVSAGAGDIVVDQQTPNAALTSDPAVLASAERILKQGLLSGGSVADYFTTPAGPAVLVATPIGADNATSGKPASALVLVKLLSAGYFDDLERRYLLRDIRIVPVASETTGLLQTGAGGKPGFALNWKSGSSSSAATAGAQLKAALTLGFLLLVMTGIGFVCWRLILTLSNNEEQARREALRDSLTGLANRAAMIACLRDFTSAERHDYAVAYADLDGFKEVNDSYGHSIGDSLLTAVGAGLSELGKKCRLLCRVGGDEFVAIFDGNDAQKEAERFSSSLLSFLSRPIEIDKRIAFVGASIGIAQASPTIADPMETLRRADIAMYKAKGDGKNCYCIYDPAMEAERAENQAIASDLAAILKTRSLGVAFQPVINAQTMKMSGVEALARWPANAGKMVTPDKFIAVAESSGLIDELGELVLDKACAAARNWPGLRLAVNISAIQINNPKFVERALATLDRHGIETRQVEFEITETSLIRDTERAKLVFKELQRHGIKIALDDFGTGFSSIGYLRTFHFDRIKIDKSIVAKVLSNPAELAIVQGTMLVARGLAASVTAEGVERDEEVAVLKLAGCTELQGFRFYKPMDAASISALLNEVPGARRSLQMA